MELNTLNDLPLFSKSRDTTSSTQPRHWTVTELTQQIRGVLEPSFSQVWLQGEVSNCRPATSGHAYFSLKDQGATIGAAVFGWGAKRRGFELKDGLQVVCRGKVSVYAPRGNYQFIVDHIEPVGAGALQLAFEQLKAKLSSEGLFDPSRKRPLPRFPLRVAMITSPSGAAIQDMLNILKRRAPQIQVLVVPAVVQGDEAPAQLIRGLEIVNRNRLADVIVLARGGGSIEDLWCFNHEGLARAIRDSALPVISGVGHEIDFTIADFAADLRAPTPSAAAEILSGPWVEASPRVREFSYRLKDSISRNLNQRKTLLSHITARVISPRDRLREQAQRTDELFHRLQKSFEMRMQKKRGTLEQWAGKLDVMSPLRILQRGFSLVRDPSLKGSIIKSHGQVKSGQELEIVFYDGEHRVRAI